MTEVIQQERIARQTNWIAIPQHHIVASFYVARTYNNFGAHADKPMRVQIRMQAKHQDRLAFQAQIWFLMLLLLCNATVLEAFPDVTILWVALATLTSALLAMSTRISTHHPACAHSAFDVPCDANPSEIRQAVRRQAIELLMGQEEVNRGATH